MTSPCVLCAAHHLAASQERVDLLRRRRRCRLRRRDASMLLALLRVRRRPVPLADRARLSRAPVTTVTSPCVLCAAHHRATARDRVDLLRQRRRCRPRRRGASTLLALLRVSAPALAARRGSARLARPRHHRDITSRSLRYPPPRHRPRARRPSAPTPLMPLAPSRRVDAARPAASSAPALAARRVSAPLACPRHHRDITLRALRCPSSCRVPRARRPSAPTPPLPPAPS